MQSTCTISDFVTGRRGRTSWACRWFSSSHLEKNGRMTPFCNVFMEKALYMYTYNLRCLLPACHPCWRSGYCFTCVCVSFSSTVRSETQKLLIRGWGDLIGIGLTNKLHNSVTTIVCMAVTNSWDVLKHFRSNSFLLSAGDSTQLCVGGSETAQHILV